jgi:hypothetical protein
MTRRTRVLFSGAAAAVALLFGYTSAAQTPPKPAKTPAKNAAAQPDVARAAAKTANGAVKITVTKGLVREHFCGPGFNYVMNLDVVNPEFYEQVLVKRWREMNPRYARTMYWERPSTPVDLYLKLITMMKESTGTEVYMTENFMRATPEGAERQQWASKLADNLEYIVQHGGTNLKWFCPINELDLGGWARLKNDMPTFKSYEQAVYNELRKRNSQIQLLATDASPVNNWNTIEWASKNMDDIVGIYGGHHYFLEFAPDDPAFYNWFKGKCEWAVGIAKARGKDFLLAEFGPRQYKQTRWGVSMDVPEYFVLANWQPLAGLQIAEGAMAAINAGVYATGYWTFVDVPADRNPRSLNQWGLFKWIDAGAEPRPVYYSYSLMTKFFRGPATVHQVEVNDAKVRVTAIQNEETKSWSIAVVNREAHAVPISVALPNRPDKAFRKYVYDPAHVPVTQDGDLQDPSGKVTLRNGSLTDKVAPLSLAVYTTAYTDEAPAAVRNLRIVQPEPGARRGEGTMLRWDPSPEKDVIYYRILHTSKPSDGSLGDATRRPPTQTSNNERIGSSIKPEFFDGGPTRFIPGEYTVIAVNQSGNASEPSRVMAPGPRPRQPRPQAAGNGAR